MCNIKKISERTNKFIKEIDNTIRASGVAVLQVDENMEELRKRARINIKKLSFLL